MNLRQLKEARLLKYGQRDLTFPEQDDFVMDMSRLTCAQTTVRAGKTTGLAIKHFRATHKYQRVMTPYIALTRDSAKNIMWPVLQDVADKFKIQCAFTESDLSCTVKKTDSVIKLFGADMQNFIARLKGIKSPLASVDEAQDFRPHIEQLVEDILIARTSEYADGQVVVTGTPGPVAQGYFYKASQGYNGFSTHKWSLFDNPYFPGARKFVSDLREKKQWEESNPTLRREYYGEWVLDPDSLLIKYEESRNHYNELPHAHWIYILGVDIGLRDSDALAVLGWNERSSEIYLIEELATRDQDITTLSNQIDHMIKKYDVAKIIMDEGGLGKKIAEELRRRKQIPVQPADKARKMENVAFLNDYLRLGRFKAKKDSLFAQDSMRVQIDWDKTTPDRIVVKNTFHSDIIDAVLYAFKESPAYTYQVPRVKPAQGTPEWAREEVDSMERSAVEHFEGLEAAEKGYGQY